jgi:hypothetical protein
MCIALDTQQEELLGEIHQKGLLKAAKKEINLAF